MSRSFACAVLRWSFGSMLLFGASSGHALAQGTIGGNWTGGSFTCGTERPRRMTLTLEERGGALSGTLSAETAPNSAERLTYRMRGTLTGSTFTLQPEPGQRMVPGSEISNVEGTFDARSEILRGTDPSSGCTVYATFKQRPDAATPPSPPPAPRVIPPNPVLAARIVNKPASYWNAYATATIKAVFEGNFGADVGGSRQFRYLFAGYVQTFSSRCRSSLPTQHTVLTVGIRSNDGITEGKSLHVDPALADKYRAYWEFLPNREIGQVLMPTSPLITDLKAMDDGERFLKTESCQGPAVSQLRENLIRASNARMSMQQEARGGTIVPTFLAACLAVHDVIVSSKNHIRNAKAYPGAWTISIRTS